MHVVYDFHTLNSGLLRHPVALTIGNFDGLHQGHQYLIDHLKKLTQENEGTSVVVTFKNHPFDVLYPKKILTKITPLEEKLRLLKKAGVDICIVLEFDEPFKEKPYDAFLHELKKVTLFDYLVLGKGASFGKNQLGKEETVKNLEKTLQFKSIFLEKKEHEGTIISSKIIREFLEKGEVEKAKALLGRPFSLYAPHHIVRLKEVGDHRISMTFDFQNHCSIPSGYYIVNLKSKERECVCIAHLTTLDCKELGKTFDLDILIKGSPGPFLNDEVILEFLRRSPPVDFDEKPEQLKAKIFSISAEE